MHLFKLGQYKGLDITPQTISETELDFAVLQTTLKMLDQWSEKNRAVAKGDEVAVSVYAVYDGLPVPELCVSHLKYKVGDPKMFAEFNNAIGKKKGDHFEMKINFPQNTPNQQIAGKTIAFTATILEVWPVKQIPFTDSIACKLDPEVKGIDSLRAKVRRSITAQNLQIIRESNLQTILETIIEKSTYELDPDELAKATHQMMNEALQSEPVFQGMNLQNRVLAGDKADPYFYEDCAVLTKQQILVDLVYREVVRLENISISEQELEEEKERLLEQMQGDEQMFQQAFPSLDPLRERLLEEKVANCLLRWNLKESD